MTTQKLYPDARTGGASPTVFGGGTDHAALASSSDSLYVRILNSDVSSTYSLDDFSIPAGATMKSYQLSMRARTPHAGQGGIVQFMDLYGGWVGGPEVGAGEVNVRPLTSSFVTYVGPVRPYAFSQSDLNNVDLGLFPDFASYTGSNYTEFAHVFMDVTYVAQPVTVVSAVTDPYTVSTSVPIVWVNTLDSDGGAQTHYEMRVFTDAQYLAGGFDPSTSTAYYETGEKLSASTTATTGPLANSDTYRAYVRVKQTVNGAKVVSDWSYDEFTMNVTTSDVDTVVGVANDSSASITVTVERDALTSAWELIEVERSENAGVTWAAVRTASVVDATGDADTFVVTDHEVPNGQAVLYRARATYYSSGLPITGDWVESSSVSWSSDDSWIKAPLDPSLNMVLCPSGFASTTRRNRSGQFDILGARDAVVVSDVLSSPSSGAVTYRTVSQGEALALDDILDGCGGVLLLDLGADSIVGPNRDGFTYVAILSTSEQWGEQFYRGGGTGRRFTTISYTTVSAPPDATSGVL